MNHEAIYSIYQDVVSISGNIAYDENGNEVIIDQELVKIESDRLKAEYNSKQYQRDRAAAYPSWQDQLDNIFHNGIDAWKTDIQAIKDQFPKP